jgi:acyl-CoA synthetase (AMP-forming)/AMP-acid ligase II
MASIRTIAAAVDSIAAIAPSRVALLSPFQSSVPISYLELSKRTNALAAWLSTYGFEKNDLLVSDLPNSNENLMLQIACNRIGVGYGTVKDLEFMAKHNTKVKGVVCTTPSSFLSKIGLPLPYLDGEFLQELMTDHLHDYLEEDIDEGDDMTCHGFYNSHVGYTNHQALLHGAEAAQQLEMTEHDIVCISVTLCHPFGIGSAVCSTFLKGGTIVLPAVGGILGCGVPSERANATLSTLESEKCTILFADTHTLKALPEPQKRLSLRGGVVKIGSGDTFLEETKNYGGVSLLTLGKKTLQS